MTTRRAPLIPPADTERRTKSGWCLDKRHDGCKYDRCQCPCHDAIGGQR